MLAEKGLDMSRFPTASHMASWVGLDPGNRLSSRKRYSGRTIKGNKPLGNIIVQGA